MLFGKGIVVEKDKTALETLESKITKTKSSYAQMKIDYGVMSDKEFKKEHGKSREVFAKDNDLTYEKK